MSHNSADLTRQLLRLDNPMPVFLSGSMNGMTPVSFSGIYFVNTEALAKGEVDTFSREPMDLSDSEVFVIVGK